MTRSTEERLAARGLELRPATLDDAAFVADMFTELFPDDPEDPALMRHWWTVTHPPGDVVERFVVLRGQSPVGFAYQQHVAWEKMPERYGRVGGEVARASRTPEHLDAVFELMERRSGADGARIFTTWSWEYDRTRIDALAARGYREERRERFWELDLAANRERLLAMTESSRARMREQGVRILTLDQDPDAEKYRKVWRMSEEAEQDVPTTVPHVPTPFEQFMQWWASPSLREDRIWIAREGDEVVGVSMLSYPPVRGVVSTDWTGTARSVRGRGVARALKCETVAQAIALGVPKVRTDNDGENVPILHINATMGYVRRPDMIQLLKEAA